MVLCKLHLHRALLLRVRRQMLYKRRNMSFPTVRSTSEYRMNSCSSLRFFRIRLNLSPSYRSFSLLEAGGSRIHQGLRQGEITS